VFFEPEEDFCLGSGLTHIAAIMPELAMLTSRRVLLRRDVADPLGLFIASRFIFLIRFNSMPSGVAIPGAACY